MAHFHSKPGWYLPERFATSESSYVKRREFVATLGLGAIGVASTGCRAGSALTQQSGPLDNIPETPTADLYPVAEKDPRFEPGDRHKVISEELHAASYNNFYEFGTNKDDPWKNCGPFEARPWHVEVSGLVDNPGRFDLVELERTFPLQERIYRHRCVERWSVVVPWIGFPLASLLEKVQPRNNARYVAFTTFDRPEQAVGRRTQTWWPWPYHEALRIDEALNELTFVVTGMYGHPLQKQNGAPVRLHLPWKYGYKSPKSIERIVVTDRRPPTFWNVSTPNEYGFYSNVDPDTPHPRWPQNVETVIGTQEEIPTLPFNGYGEWVGELYGGRVTPIGDVPHAR